MFEPTMLLLGALERVQQFWKSFLCVFKEFLDLFPQRSLIAFDSEDIRGAFFLSSLIKVRSV